MYTSWNKKEALVWREKNCVEEGICVVGGICAAAGNWGGGIDTKGGIGALEFVQREKAAQLGDFLKRGKNEYTHRESEGERVKEHREKEQAE